MELPHSRTFPADHRKKAHISQTELSERLKEEGIYVTQKGISAWETGRNDISARVFLHVCRILEIPDCLEEYFGNNPNNPLAMLNDAGKQKALTYIDMLVHPVNYLKGADVVPYPAVPADGPQVIRLRLYDARVSAGRGNFLDSDYYTIIEVPSEDARGADFAVTVSGDSMEPVFHDHDMVYVHQQETLDNGEIGIFSLNDNAYIKKLKNDGDGTFRNMTRFRYTLTAMTSVSSAKCAVLPGRERKLINKYHPILCHSQLCSPHQREISAIRSSGRLSS